MWVNHYCAKVWLRANIYTIRRGKWLRLVFQHHVLVSLMDAYSSTNTSISWRGSRWIPRGHNRIWIAYLAISSEVGSRFLPEGVGVIFNHGIRYGGPSPWVQHFFWTSSHERRTGSAGRVKRIRPCPRKPLRATTSQILRKALRRHNKPIRIKKAKPELGIS